MTTEQFVSVLGALAALITAVALLAQQTASFHRTVNGRMEQLLELTSRAAFARGRLPPVGDFPTGDPDSAPHTETHSGDSI